MSMSSPQPPMELADNLDNDKRAVMIAALSAYAEILAKNTPQLDLEQGKGKCKASDDDVDLSQEVNNQIAICGELVKSVTAVPVPKDVDKIVEATIPSWDSGWIKATSVAQRESRSEKRRQHQLIEIDEEEELLDPFTGRPITAETGYEAGPSNRLPAPLRQSPRPPRGFSPVPISYHNSLYTPSAKPLPRTPTEVGWQSASLLTKASGHHHDPDPFSSSPWIADPLRSQRDNFYAETTSENGLARMSSMKRKEVPVNHDQDIKLQDRYVAYSSPAEDVEDAGNKPSLLSSDEPAKPILDVEWDTKYRNLNDEFKSRTSLRGSYMRHLAGFASKALKNAGSVMNRNRSPSTHHTSSTQQISRLEMEPVPENPTQYTSVTELPTGSESDIMVQKANSEGLLPSDALPGGGRLSAASISSSGPLREVRKERDSPIRQYETPDDIGQQLTWRSQSPDLHRNSWSTISSTANSVITTISPDPSSPPESATETLSPFSSYADPRDELGSGEQAWPIASATRPEHGTAGPREGWRAVGVADGGIFARMGTRAKKRWTQGTASSLSTPTDGVFNADLYDTYGRGVELRTLPPTTKSLFHVDNDYPRRGWSVNEAPVNGFGSNNPWRDHMMADEALAKSLQQEEYRTQQMEQDLLLAYALADGTADEGDGESADYMARGKASLISSKETFAQRETIASELYNTFPTTATTKGMEKRRSFDAFFRTEASRLNSTQSAPKSTLKGKEKEHRFTRFDSLRTAKELQQHFLAQVSEEDASLAIAKQLQASFDIEANNDDAWQEWKKGNIDKCIVCGDEQHRDELLRPCEHGYCEQCLQDGFKGALSTKTVLKCCKTLDIEYCTGLTSQFILEYQEMALELTTLNPLYCNVAKCGAFLPPRAITGDVGTCTLCKAQTCKHCTKRHHPGTFCKEDAETNAVRDLAKTKGWKSCPGCKHLIERQSGCLHMVCSRCHTAFCYRCEKKWKDCESTCPDVISATHPKVIARLRSLMKD